MKKITYLLILMSFFSFDSKSSHIFGGEVFVTQTGPNSFIVNTRMVRYCTGITAPASMSFKVFDDSTNTLQTNFTAKKDSSVRYSGTTVSGPPYCLEVYFYSDTYFIKQSKWILLFLFYIL